MGVLAVGVGKVEEALPFFKRALDANATVEQFWLSYIDALIKLNRQDDARAAWQRQRRVERRACRRVRALEGVPGAGAAEAAPVDGPDPLVRARGGDGHPHGRRRGAAL